MTHLIYSFLFILMHINGQFGRKVDLLTDVVLIKSRFVSSAHLFPQPDSGFSR